jgi:hypothetical protein
MYWEDFALKELHHYQMIEERIDELQAMYQSLDDDITCSRIVFTDQGILIQKDQVFDQVWAREEKRRLFRNGMQRLQRDKVMIERALSKLPDKYQKDLRLLKQTPWALMKFQKELDKEKAKIDQEKEKAAFQERIEKAAAYMA